MRETIFTVRKNNKPLDISLYNWDEETGTFSTKENDLVIDFGNADNITFKIGFRTTIYCGSGCYINSGSFCKCYVGHGCYLNIGSGCYINSGDFCNINSLVGCNITSGRNSTINVIKLEEKVLVGSGSVIIFRDEDNNLLDVKN